jgi:diadenosine tetraphosphatase ApaH/serine/threonine PP2A family protein phosphatase
MLIALLSDIHGNREALDACLADARKRGTERIVFLGDYVGYGADPGYALEVVQDQVARGAIALRGNHDEAAVGSSAGMNETARAAIAWTRRRVSEGGRQFLSGLPLTHEEGDLLFVHANAVAPDRWGYVTNRLEAARSLMATRRRCVLCGHLHVPGVYDMAPNGMLGEFTPKEEIAVPLLAERRWLAVIGAVGQPRDGDPRACYAILDDRRAELTYMRVRYDVEAAAAKIRAAGLPPRLATRLIEGW